MSSEKSTYHYQFSLHYLFSINTTMRFPFCSIFYILVIATNRNETDKNKHIITNEIV